MAWISVTTPAGKIKIKKNMELKVLKSKLFFKMYVLQTWNYDQNYFWIKTITHMPFPPKYLFS